MAVVYVTKTGMKVHEGPMTFLEEMALYRSIDGGGSGPRASTTTHTRVASSPQAAAAAAGTARPEPRRPTRRRP
jgi:hypothetical protein